MRTYTRKRPEHNEIDGVHELCRLCLGKPEEAQHIFPEDTGDICSYLALRVMICVGLEVSREDNLPNIVCKECLKELDGYYSFRKKCEVSYRKLKSHILALKEKECKEAAELKQEEKQNGIINEDDNADRKQNLVYTVNMDGSIQLSDSNSLTYSEPLVTLMKMDTLEITPVVIGNEMSLAELQPQDIAVQEIKLTNSDVCVNTEILEKTEVNPPGTELSSFLSSMLVELGIMTQQGDDTMTLDSNKRMIELETGDGSRITLQLMEEDEDEGKGVETSPETNETKKEFTHAEIAPINSEKEVVPCKPSNMGRTAWCGVCEKSFASRSVATRHVRDVHARARTHECGSCGKTFAQKEVMLRHQLVHEEKRPFQCSECPKSFTQRGGLQAHRRRHVPPHHRPLALHRCPTCPKVFLYSSGLSRHMLQHSGKLFYCNCGRGFNDRSSLLRHSKQQRHKCE